MDNDVMNMQTNSYLDFVEQFIGNFATEMYKEGIIKDIDAKDLQKYFIDPDNNIGILSDLAEYFFITTGEIHMMFEMIESLPTLNHKIDSFIKVTDSQDMHIAKIEKMLYKIGHKSLVRDVLKQTANMGTLTGIWIGAKENVYPFIFDDPTKVFPSHRRNGDWVLMFDLAMLDSMNDFQRRVIYDNLKPYVKPEQYEEYAKTRDKFKRYVELPQERTFVLHTHKLRRNQSFGTGWANAAMFDTLHKRKMKNVEQAIANKVINAIAVLTIGSAENPKDYGSMALSRGIKQKIHSGVKNALAANNEGQTPVISLPEFASLEFPDVKSDGLDGKMFNNLNVDLQSSIGVSGAVLHGDSGNQASARINIDVFYRRIGVMLEGIETDMMQKFINLVLPKNQHGNYRMVYDKTPPLTTKEKVDILMRLNDKGWSVKSVVDLIDGLSWDSFLEQTLYETETLKLQTKLKPYLTSHVMSDSVSAGAPEKSENDLSDEGFKTRDGGKNDI